MWKKILNKIQEVEKSHRGLYYIGNIFMTSLFVWILYHIAMYVFLLVMPYTYWFEYESVQPIKQEFTVNEKPTFMSDTNIRRPVNITWNDVLMCDYKDWIWYRLYRSLTQTYTYTEARDLMEPWIFDIRWPLYPATCYMETFATANLHYWVSKTQTVRSKEFYFVK